MKRIWLLMIIMGLVANPIQSENNEKSIPRYNSSYLRNYISLFFMGAITGVGGLQYYTWFFGNKRLTEQEIQILRGERVAKDIEEHYGNNPVAYMTQCLADERIGIVDSQNDDLQTKEFFIKKEDKSTQHSYLDSDSIPIVSLLLQVRRNLDAYNAYAQKEGRVLLNIDKRYLVRDGIRSIRRIAITKSNRRTAD